MKTKFGIDEEYFFKKLSIIIRDLGSYKPDELARELARLSKAADEKVIFENEFVSRAVSEPEIDNAYDNDREDGWCGHDICSDSLKSIFKRIMDKRAER